MRSFRWAIRIGPVCLLLLAACKDGTGPPKVFELAVSVSGTGSVTSAPAGINCSTGNTGTCGADFASGTTVNLTAAPQVGWRFVGWGGACSGTATCSVNMTEDRAVTAIFQQVVSLAVSLAGNGTVISSPAGINCAAGNTGTCGAEFASGTSVTLTPTPAPGWVFSGWSGACTGTGACVVNMTAPRGVTATFTQTHSLSVSVMGTGTVTSAPAGISCPDDCTESYLSASEVTLTPVLAAGWEFSTWSGACTGTGTCVVSMTADRVVTATFVQQLFPLDVSVTGSGTVTSTPVGINCPSDCTENYVSATEVTLTPAPAAGWIFSGWNGACTGTGSCVVSMTAARSVTGTFTQSLFALRVSVIGSGSVGLTPEPAGSACPVVGECDYFFLSGTVVTLTPVAASGWVFSRWDGACAGTPSCVVNMTADRAVTATFTQTHTLSISVTGSGTVTSAPAGISCPGDCTESYLSGTAITLTPTAAAGSVFSSWSGACTGTGACVVSMTAPRAVTATFQQTFRLAVSIDGNGTVTSSPAGINCGTGQNCAADFLSGTTVTLTATPATGWFFSNWRGDCSGTASTCTVAMSMDRVAVPVFVQVSSLSFTGQPTNAEAGAAIMPPVQVTARDAAGNAVTGFTGQVTVAIGTNPSSGTLSGTTTVAAVAGVATFSNLSINKAGTGYTLRASATGLTEATSATFNVTHGPASKLAFLVQPSNEMAGAVITPAVQVEIQDAFGNRVTSATTTVTMAIGASPVGGTLSGTKTVGAVNGVATFADLWIDKVDTTGTGYTLTASAAQLGGATSASFTITPNVATKLIFKVQPSDAEAMAVITPAVQVTGQDAFGNTAGLTVCCVTVAIGTNPSGGTLSGTRTVNPVNGVATFADLRIDKASTGYTLTASRFGLTGATSAPFIIRVGRSTKLVFSKQPETARTGTSMPAVQVAAQDAGGNLVDTATTPVTMLIGANPPGDGTLGGTKMVSAVAGVATFSDLSIDKCGVGYTLTATAQSLTAAGSNAFTVIGLPAQLAFTGQPSSEMAGVAITPAVRVEVRDACGSPVPDATTSVTVAIGTNPPGDGTLSGTTVVGAVNGVASFSTLSIDKPGTGYTLAASATGLTGATSAPFTITPGVATQLAFTVQPNNAVAARPITPAVQVALKDRFGNTTASCPVVSCTVRVKIGPNSPGGGTLSGTTAVNPVNGVATFADLRIDKVGTGYTLVASSSAGSVVGATSSPFNVTDGPPAKLVFRMQPSTARAGVSIAPAVEVAIQDSGGNLVPTGTNSVTMQIGANPPGDGMLAGTLTVSAVAGVATFSDLRIDKCGVGYTLTATAQGLTAAGSNAFTVIGLPAQLAFTGQPSSETAGVAITPAVQVTVRDACGSPVPDVTTSVTVAIGTNPPGDGTLSGTLTVGAVNGVATFTNLSIDKAGTGYTLTANATGLTEATSAPFNITPAAAVKLLFLVQPTNTEAGAAITPAVQVTGQDAFGNTTGIPAFPNNAVTMAITSGTGTSGAMLSGTTSVFAVNGVAAFSNLNIDKAGTGYTLTASRFGLTGATSTPFNIIAGASASGP